MTTTTGDSMTGNKATTRALAGAAILTALIIAIAWFAPSAPPADPKLAGGPCATEDSNGCYWDAGKQGNELGRSFTVTKAGVVTYWDESSP